MQRKYYQYDNTKITAPNAGVPMHSQRAPAHKRTMPADEIITPQPLECSHECSTQKNEHFASAPYKSLFKNGRIFDRFETDDVILLCIIFLLFQSSDELDLPLLLALGYILLSDKDFGLI